jgi:hypothetical protein
VALQAAALTLSDGSLVTGSSSSSNDRQVSAA